MLANLRAGSASSIPQYFIEAGGKLYFKANDGINGSEPWVYDPAVAVSATNPQILFNAAAGSASGNFLRPKLLDNKIYYYGYSQSEGNELWVFDTALTASSSNPSMVVDLRSGNSSANIYDITPHNGKLYFRGEEAQNSSELYEYNPNIATSATNPLLLDINPGSGQSRPHSIVTLTGNLFFGIIPSSSGELLMYNPNDAFDPTGANPESVDGSLYDDYITDMLSFTYSVSVTE